LVTNDFDSSSEEIGNLIRWKIELFFKWIKQNLKITRFYGRSPNAIKTQIYIAMIGYLLVKMFHKIVNPKATLLEFLRVLRPHLLSHKGHIWRFWVYPPQKNNPPPSQFSLFNWPSPAC